MIAMYIWRVYVHVLFLSLSKSVMPGVRQLGSQCSRSSSAAAAYASHLLNEQSLNNLAYIWADYDGAEQLMAVYFSNTSTKPSTPVMFSSFNLTNTIGGSSAYVAVAAGVYNKEVYIDNDYFEGYKEINDKQVHSLTVEAGEACLALHKSSGQYVIWEARKAPPEDGSQHPPLKACAPNMTI